MTVQFSSHAERVLTQMSQYVARSVAVPSLVVDRAEGGRIWDVDGREFIDFGGGIGCQNVGHRSPAVVAAIHEQVDRYLHQCFLVGGYDPYVQLCRRLADLYPAADGEYHSVLLNSGAEAVENAVKIARIATSRPAVVVFDHAFHGRTLLGMTMTGKCDPYKKGFGPFAPEVYRAAAPYPFRGIDTDHALSGIERLFKISVDPATVACIVLEPVQGEGGFIPMPSDFLDGLVEICRSNGILFVADEVQSGIGRTGRTWAIEHSHVTPDLILAGKSLGGGLPLASVTGRADVVDAVPPGGLGTTFGGNPVACAAAIVVLDEVSSVEFRARADRVSSLMRDRLDEIAARVPNVGEVRGLGPMLALELVKDPASEEPAAELTKQTLANARERGLILLACGAYGNVIRLLVPILDDTSDVEEGLSILEQSLVEAAAAVR